MTTFAELKAQHIAELEQELAFKEAALRYCYHSKKQAKLVRQVNDLRMHVAFMKGELSFEEIGGYILEEEPMCQKQLNLRKSKRR